MILQQRPLPYIPCDKTESEGNERFSSAFFVVVLTSNKFKKTIFVIMALKRKQPPKTKRSTHSWHKTRLIYVATFSHAC